LNVAVVEIGDRGLNSTGGIASLHFERSFYVKLIIAGEVGRSPQGKTVLVTFVSVDSEWITIKYKNLSFKSK